MSSLYGILAMTDVIHKLPTYMLIAFAGILLIAFIIGFVKGFRKVAWGGFYWLLAGIGFIVAYQFLGKKNPLTSVLTGKFANTASFAWAFVLALGCILVSLLLYGIFGAIFRPREVVAKERDEEMDEYGFAYEEEWENDKITDNQEIIIVKGGGKPKFFGRLAGGFMCAVNAAALLAVVTAVFLLVIRETAFYRGYMGAMFDIPLVKIAMLYIKAYALDFFTIGIIMLIAYKGYKTGFVGSARAILATFGVIAVVVAAFALPFTKLNSFHFIKNLIIRCDGLYTRVKPEFRGVFAKLTAGALMAIAGAIVVLIINFILKKATDGIGESNGVRVIDGILAAILYLIIGAAVVAVFWAILYLLDYCGIFYTSDAFSENSFLSKEFFKVAETYLKNFADKYLLQLKAK